MDREHDTPQTTGPESAVPAPISSFAATPETLVRLALQPPDSLRSLGKLDDYEVVQLIGGGGMGYVLRARHTGSGRELAIKLLRPELVFDPMAVRRFLREARHMKELGHPNILKIHETVSRAEGPYFVMDLVPSGSLARQLNDGQPLERDKTLTIARQVAVGLAHAHALGIIHRDLKPGNILVDAEGRAYLTDFGLARTLINDSVTDIAEGAILGTVPYLSPGAASGLAEDTRCDIYAFGAVLYEMLTGSPPYTGGTVAEVRDRILAGPPPAIRELNPGADRRLAAIAEVAMARALRNRYASMEDVVADLDCLAAGHDPECAGRRGSAAPRGWLRHWAQTGRTRAARSFAALFGVGFLVVAGWFWISAQRGSTIGLTLEREFHIPGLWELDHARIAPGTNGDRPTLLVAQDNRVFRLSLAGDLLHSFTLPDPQSISARLWLVDPDGTDGGLQTAVSWVSGHMLKGSLLALDGTPLQRFEVAAPSDPTDPQTTRSRLTFQGRTRLIAAGPEQLLGRVDTLSAPAMRGVVCFDIADGSLTWFVPTTSKVLDMITTDLDGDGSLEVVVGTAAVAPGQTLADGPHDGQAEVLALDAQGEVRWRWIAGDRQISARPLLVPRADDQPVELYAWTTASPDARAINGSPEVCRVVHLTLDGTVLRDIQFDHQVISCLAGDLDGDGSAEVLVTDRLGIVYVLDAQLEVRQRARLLEPQQGRSRILLHAVADLNDDGQMEIIVDVADGRLLKPGASPSAGVGGVIYDAAQLVILDADLRVRARHPLPITDPTGRRPPRVAVWNIDADPSLEIVYCWQDRVRVYALR